MTEKFMPKIIKRQNPAYMQKIKNKHLEYPLILFQMISK